MNDVLRYAVMDSPFGSLTLVSGPRGLESIRFGEHPPAGAEPDLRACRTAIRQLDEYFSRRRRVFDLPLAPEGTPFQRSVWRELLQIGWGETRTYGDIARALGKPQAARAVGMANHNNPIPIVIPCHRVVGADGSLTGYAGGLEVKARLLALERGLLTKEQTATSHSRGRSTAARLAP